MSRKAYRDWLKYTILRRLINRRFIDGKKPFVYFPDMTDLQNVLKEMEGKNMTQLKRIHKKWIGYI